MKAFNNMTKQFCKFILDNGLPTSADPDTLESATLKWVEKIRSQQKSIHPSDLAIIQKSGLFDKIFVPIPPDLPLVSHLQKQVEFLTQQLAKLTDVNSHSNLEPTILEQKSRTVNSYCHRRAVYTQRFHENFSSFENKALEFLISKGYTGATACQIRRKLMGGYLTSEQISKLIDSLLSKKLIVEKSETSNHYKPTYRIYYILSSFANPNDNQQQQKSDDQPVRPCHIGFFDKYNSTWRYRRKGILLLSATCKQLSRFFNTNVPEDETISLPYWLKFFELSRGSISTDEAKIDVSKSRLAAVESKTAAVKEGKKRKANINNPNLIWAKMPPCNADGEFQFSKNLSEEDLIGHCTYIKKNGGKINVGIENYVIYPSGNIRFYIRMPDKTGGYSWMIYRWGQAKDILDIRLKDGYDPGPLRK